MEGMTRRRFFQYGAGVSAALHCFGRLGYRLLVRPLVRG